MEHFYQNVGEVMFNYPILYSGMVRRASPGARFVEVGSWKGMSAAFMAVEIINSKKNITFHCVDTWAYLASQKEFEEARYENLYETFLKNIEPVKDVVTPVRSISWEGAAHFADASLDFVFIDAAHDYDSVTKDLSAWRPKLKPGGAFAGHDYGWCEDVRWAVHDFFPGQLIFQCEGCWIYFCPPAV